MSTVQIWIVLIFIEWNVGSIEAQMENCNTFWCSVWLDYNRIYVILLSFLCMNECDNTHFNPSFHIVLQFVDENLMNKVQLYVSY